MSENDTLIRSRKRDHLAQFRSAEVSARNSTTWLEHVRFIHEPLPRLSLDEIDLATNFAGHSFAAPLFITGMTGGTDEAGEINRGLARIAGEFGIGFGVGSQRAMLVNPALTNTYSVRAAAPGVFLAGNIGGNQIVHNEVAVISKMIADIEADALCIHLNPAQELMQAEGERDFRGIEEAIRTIVAGINVPVIVKETGAGIGRETALLLNAAGVKYVDASGVGGTTWTGVELMRRGLQDDPELSQFCDWGLPTAAAVIECVSVGGLQVMASGGIRTGLDVARALALGADVCGMAAPVLRAWFDGGGERVRRLLKGVVDSLRIVCALTGSRSVADLRLAPKVLEGPLAGWSERRGLPAGDGVVHDE